MRVCHHCEETCKDEDRLCAACGSSLVGAPGEGGAGDPLIGRTIAGAYTLQDLIGVGGMGRVYRAEQSVLGRTVALKVIHPHLLSDEQVAARFYNEAKAASRLNHPNSVGIIDFGRTDDGMLYLVMEHLTGKDLALVMHEEGPLPFGRIAGVLDGVLDALAEAHALGVIHRDLKPENIILRRFRSGTDLVKVVDFGLATIVGAGNPSITRPGLVCGTPDYMSPEQARGEEVDGRGDLYSLGVVLFELLTEQLPFPADTPTKVVLRHINDPIPDPRDVCKHRAIPAELAEVTMKALAKSAAQRFQSADEMRNALGRAALSIESGARARFDAITCSICGETNTGAMRFCGSCGARLTGRMSVPPSVRPARRMSLFPARSERPLIGRDAELAQINAARQDAAARSRWLRVVGEVGVGKTRLLEELATRYSELGDALAFATPHPSGAYVPYHAARMLLSNLLSVPIEALVTLDAESEVLDHPLARAGLSEMLAPTGVPGMGGKARSGAVAAVLAMAIRGAREQSPTGRVTLLVDDLHRCDELTREALAHAVAELSEGGLFLVTADAGNVDGGSEILVLPGLDRALAPLFVGGDAGASPILSPDAPTFLPLYLEQAVRLTRDGTLADEVVPPRIADVLSLRLERLDVSSRRILQAAAVLGEKVRLDALKEMVQGTDLRGIETLRREQILRVTESEVEFSHPLLREVVHLSIPAEACKTLHARALELALDEDAPLEVRAEHAYRAGDPMSALLLLERMGRRSSDRGDNASAVLAFRRGLALARREMLEAGDLSMERAIVTFSRNLGEALERHGDLAGADGVLREALDLTPPESRERARMLVAIARVSARRKRTNEAMRALLQALQIATDLDDPDLESRVQTEIGRLRHDAGDDTGSANAYRRALSLLATEHSGDASLRARIQVDLAEALAAAGSPGEARDQLVAAVEVARSAGALAVTAEALGALGRLAQLAGEREASAERYDEAARVSAEAGDAAGHAFWRRAAASLAA